MTAEFIAYALKMD